MSTNKRQLKQSVPSTIMLKSIPSIGTLTQMVSPTPKEKNRSVDYGTSYMVSRKATTFHHTKLRRIVHQGQPTMTQTFKNAPEKNWNQRGTFRINTVHLRMSNIPICISDWPPITCIWCIFRSIQKPYFLNVLSLKLVVLRSLISSHILVLYPIPN